MLVTVISFCTLIAFTWARSSGGVDRGAVPLRYAYLSPALRNNRYEPAEILMAVSRGRIALPCDIISPMEGDEVYLVLWYKDEIATPIYSLDARRGHLGQARHASSDNLSGRAYFSTVPRPAVLEVTAVTAEDEGDYRCRVDFRKAQTRNYQIALKVMVPPGKPDIKDAQGKILRGIIGPYNEGESLFLVCESQGGKPPPFLTWWKGSVLLDDTYELLPQALVRNELIVPSLDRRDLMALLSCQASNNNISLPVSTSITLDLNFRPLLVKIQGQRRPLSEGRSVQLKCVTQGSRPPAVITWRKGGTRFKDTQEDITTGGNATVSIFTFTPTHEDHGRFLYCQAENPVVPGSMIEDGWKLEVHFVPQLTLRLGSKLRHSNIVEGNDVYFECNIRATPWVSETGWRFEGQELHTNISAGIIVSNQSLVLQKVKRANRGRYSCTATNTEGQGESNHVYLRVQYSPVCKPGQQAVYGAMLHYPVQITCEVESDPDDVNFRWVFNSSSGTSELVATTNTGRKSVVNYIPRSELDYGTLSCWGRNHVGLQRIPCLFVVIPAEPPAAVHNCTVTAETERSFRVFCFEGKDGGLSQYFRMEVRDAATEELLLNVSAQTADFSARGLNPGFMYKVTLYAVNAKGRSLPIVIKATTLASPESQTRKEDVWQLNVSPVLMVLVVVVGGLVLVAFSVVLYLKIQGRRNLRKGSLNTLQKKPTTCTDLEHQLCSQCMCERREDQAVHFPTENYVMIEKTKPENGSEENSIKRDSVYWRKLSLDASDSDNYINPRLTIKLPLKTDPEKSDIERRMSGQSGRGVGEEEVCQNTDSLRPLQSDESAVILPVSGIRHTDV